MEKRLQQRLIGAAVIIALAVIFLPMLLNGGGSNKRVSMKMQIPPEPSYSFNGAAQPPAASSTAPVQPISVMPVPSTAASQQSAQAAPQQAPVVPEQQAAPAPQPAPKAVEPKVMEPKVTAPSKPVQQKPAPAKPAPQQPTPAQNEAATGGKPVTPAWVVQVVSLSKESDALNLRNRLRKQGFSAYVDRFDDKGKVYYRVRIGPKLTRAGAEKQQAKILKATKLKGIVVPYK